MAFQSWVLIKENNKERKHVFDQENDQEKKKVFLLFIGRFLGRVRVFFLFSWPLSFFFLLFAGRFLCPTSNERADKVISRGRLA